MIADLSSDECRRRFLRILRGTADCPRCGAVGDDPCLTWRGDTFLDGTQHEERLGRSVVRVNIEAAIGGEP
jgi:hypothetical protein